MHINNYFKDKVFISGISIWIIATVFYFIFTSWNFNVSPIAEDGLISLLTIYIPVVLLAVFLLLYLTRDRNNIDWEENFTVNKSTAKKEAWLVFLYLLITQLILGIIFNIGLHFPGTDIYSSGSHSQFDVWVWVITYTFVYTILPMLWLRNKGFSLKKLFASLSWRRDIWIILVYWAIDFFGPIVNGASDFVGGISASQYAQGIPWGIFINTFGAGLPVIVMMHIIFIPRIAVLTNNKLTIILVGGLFYSMFSLFDQGTDYSSIETGLMTFTYIIMTQTLVGMGKSAFTVITGNPFIHFITLHVISARVPFDTRMYVEIFRLK